MVKSICLALQVLQMLHKNTSCLFSGTSLLFKRDSLILWFGVGREWGVRHEILACACSFRKVSISDLVMWLNGLVLLVVTKQFGPIVSLREMNRHSGSLWHQVAETVAMTLLWRHVAESVAMTSCLYKVDECRVTVTSGSWNCGYDVTMMSCSWNCGYDVTMTSCSWNCGYDVTMTSHSWICGYDQLFI